MFKYNKKLLPTVFNNMFAMSKTSKRVTRSNSQIIHTSCSSNIRQQSIRFMGPKIWNSFPKVIKDSSNFKSFQNQLTKYYVKINTQD